MPHMSRSAAPTGEQRPSECSRPGRTQTSRSALARASHHQTRSWRRAPAWRTVAHERTTKRGVGGAHPPGAPSHTSTMADYVSTFKELFVSAKGYGEEDHYRAAG